MDKYLDHELLGSQAPCKELVSHAMVVCVCVCVCDIMPVELTAFLTWLYYYRGFEYI